MPNTTALTRVKVFTVNSDFDVLDDATVVFDDTQILAVGPSGSVTVPADADVRDGGNRTAVLPGLIDVHSHSSLLKGFSENAQLMDWLPEYQREHQVLSEQDAF
jgi:5-methylthioadenosine/S-adenosylhomocysteine deaminase